MDSIPLNTMDVTDECETKAIDPGNRLVFVCISEGDVELHSICQILEGWSTKVSIDVSRLKFDISFIVDSGQCSAPTFV